MAQYHVNDKGEAKPCTAKIKCRLGASWDEHYENKKGAQQAYEEQQEMLTFLVVNKKHKNNPLTDRALSSSLKFYGEAPQWLNKLNEEIDSGSEAEGKNSEVIDVIDTNVGKLAVVWNDKHPGESKMDGWILHSLEYRDFETGEVKGYLKSTYITDDSHNEAFGNDAYSSFKWYCSRNLGSGIVERDYKTDNFVTPNDVDDENERLEMKKELWANAYKRMHTIPESVKQRGIEEEQRYYNLSSKHSPDSEEKIDEEIAEINKEYKQLHEDYKKSYSVPYIDYSNIVDDKLKGQGLGASMYVYASRKLSEKGLALSASGTQTDEAQKMWKRLASDKRLPIKVKSKRFKLDEYESQYDQRFVMDFTKFKGDKND